MSENLSENWVVFNRFYCLNGYIDKWVGDSINNPNRNWKHSLCLNSRVTYFRLNQNKWICFRNYQDIIDLMQNINDCKELFSAEDIWNFTLNKKT